MQVSPLRFKSLSGLKLLLLCPLLPQKDKWLRLLCILRKSTKSLPVPRGCPIALLHRRQHMLLRKPTQRTQPFVLLS